MRGRVAGRAARAILGAALWAAALGAGASAADAQEAPPAFWKSCENNPPMTSGAGECTLPRGVAVQPDAPGHLFVADNGNGRIVELTAWGEFVKAWGWGVRDGETEQLQTCGPGATPSSECFGGGKGAGVGEFNGIQGIAVDSAGDVYAVDRNNHRVQKFSPEGEFLLMLGGEVNETSGGNVCPRPGFPADACKAEPASTGPGNGQFSASWPVSSYIAIDRAGTATAADDTVYVGDENRVQEFDSEGQYTGEVTFAEIHAENPEFPETGRVGALAADPASGDLYLALPQPQIGSENIPNVYKIDPGSAATACEATPAPQEPTALAGDSADNLYVVNGVNKPSGEPREVRVFDSACDFELAFGEGEFDGSTGIATGGACLSEGTGVYLSNSVFSPSFVRAWGPFPEDPECPPPAAAPSIEDQWAVTVGVGEASVRARVNPHFFSGAFGETDYYVQYATAACIEAQGWEGGCVQAHPAPPGAKLQAGVVDEAVMTAAVFLGGLQPGTAYRYRFAAEGSGAPGEPVFGVGGTPGEDGEEAAFTTFGLPEPPNAACPNQALRSGASASLPDCRAYEMVSPVDKEGGDVFGFEPLVQAAASGEGFTYTSYRAFADPQSAPLNIQYLASRGGAGWSSEALNPPKEGASFEFVSGLSNLFQLFSPELSEAWLNTATEPVLAPGGQPGQFNLYRRDNASGGYEACSTASPASEELFVSLPRGASADGRHGFFTARVALPVAVGPEAAAGEKEQIYECSVVDGGPRELALASVLPDGSASAAANGVGSNLTGDPNNAQTAFILRNMASADGSRLYWGATGASGEAVGPGALYVRLNPDRPESAAKDGEGDCLPETGRACTLAVSEGDEAGLWAAAADGSAALYEEDGALHRFDADAAIAGEEARSPIAAGLVGLVGSSEDLSRAYLVSEEDCSDEPPNGRGEEAEAGEPNLYRYEAGEECSEGELSFLATLATDDVSGGASPVNPKPQKHAALSSPDGSALLFASRSAALAQATAGYDNTDRETGQPVAELYRYEAASGDLACLSCNPGGARPTGAPGLPVWETSFHAPRALSDDGRRVFFESDEALVLADANGAADVYEWEAPGAGDCTGARASFVPASGGCLALVSSGKTPSGAEFLDASADGSDVFIRTAASLVPADPGSVDVYDARVGGGFAGPGAPPPPCEGEACQSPPPAPEPQTPGSASFQGPGNPGRGASCAAPARRAKRLSGRAKRLRRNAGRAARNGKRGKAKSGRAKSRRLAHRARGQSKRAKRCRRSKRGQRR